MIAFVIVLGTWSLFRQSLHLLFDGVPEGIDLHAVRRELEALPGVDRVHDLHVWATGTTETALTAHLVMPHGHADDRFLEDATRRAAGAVSRSGMSRCRSCASRSWRCAPIRPAPCHRRRHGPANESERTGSIPS